MTEHESTDVVLLTPPGRGAVASLLIDGPAACQVLADCFAPAAPRDAAALPIGRIVFGRWTEPPVEGEEVVVARRGEQRIEVHSHGGDAVSRAMLASLAARGCRPRKWEDAIPIVDRSLAVAPPNDQLAVEARVALGKAGTDSTAAMLLDQWRGALRIEVDAIRQLLADGPTDETVQWAHSRLEALLQRGRLGLHLTEPFRVVLAGRPNVGKSSLVNSVLGYGRALVYDQPGTTRDVVSAHTAIAGWPVELCDTAGLRGGAEVLESLGIEKARQRIAAADLIVVVLDASRPLTDEDHHLLDNTRDPLIALNKCDLGLAADESRPAGVPVSALSGEGVEQLTADIARRLVPAPATAGQPIPFTVRQLDRLRAARQALEHSQPEEATESLEQL